MVPGESQPQYRNTRTLDEYFFSSTSFYRLGKLRGRLQYHEARLAHVGSDIMLLPGSKVSVEGTGLAIQ